MTTEKLAYADALREPSSRQRILQLLKQRRNATTSVACAIIAISYALGIYILLRIPAASLTAIPLLLWSMLWAWYLSHDCAHLSALTGKRNYYVLGDALAWINGLAYFDFADYAKDHLRHHAEHVDLVGLDLKRLLQKAPPGSSRILLTLEWAYIPAFHYLIKISAALARFRTGTRIVKARILAATTVTVLLWLMILKASWYAAAAFAATHFLRVHIVRFVDAFQHSYDQVAPDALPGKRSRLYEQMNTFSFPVIRKFRLFNLLILNFGYHNAHHAAPSCPWYLLPRLDRMLATPDQSGTTSPGILELLRAYHRGRCSRILSGTEGLAYDESGNFSLAYFTGAFTDNLLG
jgi:fatty acid desaturase